MKQTALNYLGRASIIPLNGKLPAIKSWKEYQTRKPTVEEVEKWWTKNPNYNIGIVTGKVSNLTVVDVDQEERPDWLPKTLIVKTGKGWHYYYQYCEGMSNMARVKENIDIRSEGGYVVAAGSVHPDTGKKYEVVDLNPIAVFPSQLFGIKKEKANWTELAQGAPEGQRNESAAKYIGKLMQMFSRDTWENTVWETALIWNQKNNPPLSEYELRVTYNSIAGRESSKTKGKDSYPIKDLDLLSVVVNGKTKYPKCAANCNRLLENHPDFKGKFRFDEFSHQGQFKKENKWVRITDELYVELQNKIQELYPQFNSYGMDIVINAVNYAADMNRVDSVLEWTNTLTWDKKSRIDNFCQNAYGVEDNLYHRIVGKNFWLGLGARILKPGCHHRFVLILKGAQNTKKSKSFRELAGNEWFLEDAPLPSENISFFMSLWGKLVVEFSEGVVFHKADMGKIKSIVSTPQDTIVKKWGRNPMDIKRRCVFVITLNQDTFLSDPSGNTRFFPVETKDIDLEYIKENRDQLFAEAIFRIKAGELWWDEGEEETKVCREAQESCVALTSLEERIEQWTLKSENQTKVEDGFLLSDMLRFLCEREPSRSDENLAADCLRKLGFFRDKNKRTLNNFRGRFWKKETENC